MNLSKQAMQMLRDLERGPMLRGRWDWSSMRLPAKLQREGYIEVCDHPTVKERPGEWPAQEYRLTDKGRAALKDETE